MKCPTKIHATKNADADAPVEMTRWRYDVWLLKGELPEEAGVTVGADGPAKRSPTVKELPFEGQRTLDEALALMQSPNESADAVLVANVPNARVLDAVTRFVEDLAETAADTRLDI